MGNRYQFGVANDEIVDQFSKQVVYVLDDETKDAFNVMFLYMRNLNIDYHQYCWEVKLWLTGLEEIDGKLQHRR